MKILLILSAAVGVALSATAYSPASGKYCYYQKQLINVGETYYPPNECMEISCLGSNGQAKQVNYLTCPPTPQTDSPNVVVVERRELQYPKCCPTLSGLYRNNSPLEEDLSINDIPDNRK